MSTCKTTVLVLKDPKSESSVRKVWLPKTLAYILREWRKSQGKLREMLGEEYVDYDLVITQPNGRPCENKLIEEAFNKLKATAGLPNVVFHSLRSSSTTYKLKMCIRDRDMGGLVCAAHRRKNRGFPTRIHTVLRTPGRA